MISSYLISSCMQISQEAGKVVWYSHLFKNFPQFGVIHTVKGFSGVNKAEIGFFWDSLTLNIYFFFFDYAKAFHCVDHNKLENSERDGNTKPPDLPLEKPKFKSGSNS